LSTRKTNVPMPNGKTQWMFVCPNLNAALVEDLPSQIYINMHSQFATSYFQILLFFN